MSDQLGNVKDGSEGKGTFERLLRLGVLGVFTFALIGIVGDWLQKVIDNTKRSHITGDFETIGKALDRRALKDPFLDTDVTKMQGEELATVPRDPWGTEYVYDWFNGRLVSAGPDRVVGTRVPGFADCQPGQSSDDEVQDLKSIPQLIVAVKDGDGFAIQMMSQHGEQIRELTKVPGKTVTGLDALGSVVVASARQGDKQGLTVVTYANGLDQLPLIDPPYSQQMADILSGPEEMSAPSLYSPSNDWTFVSMRKKGGSWDLYKVGYKDKSKAQLTTSPNEENSPAVDVNEKMIYYSGKADKNLGIFRFPMSSYQAPTLVHKVDGADLKSPSPGPIGDQLAYLEVKGASTVLKVIDDKKKELFSATDPLPNTPIIWSASGDKVGYYAQTASGPVLTLVHPRKKLTFSLDFLQDPLEPVRFAWLGR